jgi:protein-L-isoaspartate O-methyltransferase
MSNNNYDPTAFKAQQREQWSNTAEGWRRRWATLEKSAQPVSDRMMELAHVTPGKRVLDIATGIGEPAMTAARRVGPSGSVVAIDQAPQMLTIARERMQAAGLQNVEFIEGDVETAALPADSFDAVVCRWGLMFFPDVAGTLTRLRSSLVPGGWLVAIIWGPPEQVPLIWLPFSVFSREFLLPSALPAGPNPFALADPAALEQVMRDAGFAEVQSEWLTVTYEFSSVEELLNYEEDTSPPVRSIMASLSVERQAELWGKLADAAMPFVGADGIARLPNECLIVSGQRQ